MNRWNVRDPSDARGTAGGAVLSAARPGSILDRRLVDVALGVVVAVVVLQGAASHGQELKPKQVRAAALELAELLEGNYLFPDIARQYGDHLRSRTASGAYDPLVDASDLSAAFEEELNALHADAHLRVRTTTDGGGDTGGPRRVRAIPQGPALSGARWFGEDVAYVAVNLLPGDPESQRAMAAFLDQYQGARALILDLRACPGGTLAVMDVLFSRLYAERTHLLTMDTRVDAERRGGAVFDGTPTLTREAADDGIVRRFHWAVPSEAGSPWTEVPVYVLTGSTGSACEHLSLALKASERATLIGTATGGAGHYGGLREFGDGRFNVFVPVGRTYDPRTGRDWEGTGVTPHIETTAEAALDRALAELGIEMERPKAIEGAPDYTGTYGNRRVTLEQGTLYLQRIDVAAEGEQQGPRRRVAPKLELRRVEDDEFELPRIPGAKVRFERDADGRVSGIAVLQRDGRWEQADRSAQD